MGKAAWVVDIGYVVKASEGIFRLDYAMALRLLEGRLGSTQAFLFNGYDPDYGVPEGLQAFYSAMEQQGMVVRLQPMQSGPPGSNRQRRVDVDLGAHLVWQAGLTEITSLVLTTGDQDLVPAVDVARQRCGKRVILFTYRANVHHGLEETVDEWWLFENEREEIAWRPYG